MPVDPQREPQQTDPTSTTATPPGSPPGAAVPPKVEQQPEKKEAKDAAPPPASPKLLSGDDDEDIDDKSPYQITGAALKKRLGRFSKKQLREQFGTDDPDVIKTKLQKLDQMEARAEEERRSKLDEQERTKEDLRREKERADAAEARANAIEENRIVERQDVRLSNLAGKYIDEEVLEDVVLPKFARFLKKNYSEKEINALTESDIETWFKEYAEKHPRFAKEQPTPPKKEPLTTTTKAGDRPPPANGTGEKTFKPGQPNSYTKEEMIKQGIRY